MTAACNFISVRELLDNKREKKKENKKKEKRKITDHIYSQFYIFLKNWLVNQMRILLLNLTSKSNC